MRTRAFRPAPASLANATAQDDQRTGRRPLRPWASASLRRQRQWQPLSIAQTRQLLIFWRQFRKAALYRFPPTNSRFCFRQMSASVLFRKPTPGLSILRGRAAAPFYFGNKQARGLSQRSSVLRKPPFALRLPIVWARLEPTSYQRCLRGGYASCHPTRSRRQRIPACNRVPLGDLMSSNENFIQNGAS